MNVPLPMGKKEGLHLEFKGRETLKEPAKIVREVVGMLNAAGGEVWVGIAVKDGLAAALEPIDDADLARQQLREHLLDTIEPPPLPVEVQVEPVPLADGRAVLRVAVRSGQTKPYAQLHKLMRTYVVRVEDQIRHMTREEIGDTFRNEPRTLNRRQETLNKVEKRRTELQQKRRPILWVSIHPAFEISIDPRSDKPTVEPLFRDPSLTGNRHLGWNFTSDRESLQSKEGRLCFGKEDWFYVELAKNGAIELRVPLQFLHSNTPQQVLPYALLEYPTSLFRFAEELYARLGGQHPSSEIIAAMALIGIRGWTLKPGSPNFFSPGRDAHQYEEAEDLVVEPIVLEWSDLEERPDWGAFRLIRQVYEAFGFSEEQVPPEFRRELHMLIIPN